MIQIEEGIVAHTLASLTISALLNRVAPTHEQVMHHLDIACERAGLIRTHASTIRMLERISREIARARSVLDFIGRGEVQPH